MGKNWSFSRLEGLVTCARRFYYDLKDPAPPTPDRKRAFDLGSQVHTGMEWIGRRMKAGHTFADALRELGPVPGPLSQDTLRAYVRSAQSLLEACPPTRLEEYHRRDDLTLSGKIDAHLERTPLLDGNGVLVGSSEGECIADYKTSANPRNWHNERTARRSMQLRIYSIFTGVRTAGFVYLTPTALATLVFITFTEEEITEARQWVAAQVRALELLMPLGKEAFPMTDPHNPLCSTRWCSFYNRCFPK